VVHRPGKFHSNRSCHARHTAPPDAQCQESSLDPSINVKSQALTPLQARVRLCVGASAFVGKGEHELK
jgi:hypothetical protein